MTTMMSKCCFTMLLCGLLSIHLFFKNTFVCRDEEEEDDEEDDEEEEEEEDIEESPVKACLFFGSSTVCI